MALSKKYCVDCGARLIYYPNLSNPKAPNELRLLVYACPDCTKTFDKPKFVAIKRSKSADPFETIKVTIVEETKSTSKSD